MLRKAFRAFDRTQQNPTGKADIDEIVRLLREPGVPLTPEQIDAVEADLRAAGGDYEAWIRAAAV